MYNRLHVIQMWVLFDESLHPHNLSNGSVWSKQCRLINPVTAKSHHHILAQAECSTMSPSQSVRALTLAVRSCCVTMMIITPLPFQTSWHASPFINITLPVVTSWHTECAKLSLWGLCNLCQGQWCSLWIDGLWPCFQAVSGKNPPHSTAVMEITLDWRPQAYFLNTGFTTISSKHFIAIIDTKYYKATFIHTCYKLSGF